MDEILANINKKLEEIDRKKVSIGLDEEENEGNGDEDVPDPMADFVDAEERESNGGGRYSPTKSAAPRRRGSTTEVSALNIRLVDITLRDLRLLHKLMA